MGVWVKGLSEGVQVKGWRWGLIPRPPIHTTHTPSAASPSTQGYTRGLDAVMSCLFPHLAFSGVYDQFELIISTRCTGCHHHQLSWQVGLWLTAVAWHLRWHCLGSRLVSLFSPVLTTACALFSSVLHYTWSWYSKTPLHCPPTVSVPATATPVPTLVSRACVKQGQWN
jgi:hypothetical protein